MTSYDFDYAIQLLRQAIDFAEVEDDFVLLRKWANEVERSGQELEAIEGRLNLPAGQQVLLSMLKSVSNGTLSPEEAFQKVRHWLADGQVPNPKTEPVPQYEFA